VSASGPSKITLAAITAITPILTAYSVPIGRERRGDGKPANRPAIGLMLSHRMLNDRHFAEARPRNRYSPLLVVLSVVSRGTAPSATLACAYTPTDLCSERVFDAIRKWMRVRGYRLAGPKREMTRNLSAWDAGNSVPAEITVKPSTCTLGWES